MAASEGERAPEPRVVFVRTGVPAVGAGEGPGTHGLRAQARDVALVRIRAHEPAVKTTKAREERHRRTRSPTVSPHRKTTTQ